MPAADPPLQVITTIPRLPPRPPAMHKGQAGKVAVIAGSRGMSGAAVLCGLGALRGGAGLVRVFTPECVQPIVAASEPCLMTTPLAGTRTGDWSFKRSAIALGDAYGWSDVTAMGPGMGGGRAVSELVHATFQCCPKPMVLDADGLNVLASMDYYSANGWRNRQAANTPANSPAIKPPVVVTPHPGEMARLRKALKLHPVDVPTDDSGRLRCAGEFAIATNTSVVLKGHRTVVTEGRRAYVNTTGNPGMATGGMGDVLTGLIAALIAQGMPAFDAAVLGVYAHGAAADLAAARIGATGYLAREVADLLPAVIHHQDTKTPRHQERRAKE
jgi:NAD(P)H-hydrate epimerase